MTTGVWQCETCPCELTYGIHPNGRLEVVSVANCSAHAGLAGVSVNTWKPDTCGCWLVYQGGDNLDPTVLFHLDRCSGHAAGDTATVQAACATENVTKNRMRAAMLQHLGIAEQEGGEDPFRWSFAPDRTLEVWASDRQLTPADRTSIQQRGDQIMRAANPGIPVHRVRVR